MMMSSILFTSARFAFLSELFDVLQYKAVAVTIPSIAPIQIECFIIPSRSYCVRGACGDTCKIMAVLKKWY